MYDLSKEKDKEFLKEANRWLQEQLLLSKKENAQLKREKELDKEICVKLSDELHILRQKFFANKQEKIANRPPKKKRKKVKLPHNIAPLAAVAADEAKLEEAKEVHQIVESLCPCEDPECHLREMTGCFEESSEIEVTERKYTHKRHQRQKYTGTLCGKITTAPGKEKLVTGGDFSIQMGVQVACDKFEQHLP